MKSTSLKRMAAALIAVTVAVSPLAGSSVYGASLGNELSKKSIQTTDTTQLTNGVYYSTKLSDKVTENYVTYAPGGQVAPIVAYGNDIYGAASFKTVVANAEAAGKHVIAGINADYFTMANGVATGLVIQDGILKTSESSNYTSIGFKADGSALIARSGLNVRVTSANFPTTVSRVHLNKAVSNTSGLVMYTDAFHDTNKATIPTFNVLVDVAGDQPRMNQTMTGVVEAVNSATGATAIPDGKVLLTMSANSAYPTTLAQMKEMKVGDSVTFTFEGDASWNDVIQGVGGGEKLLTKGINVAPASAERAPRTAMGIKADGSIIFYTIDGRQKGYSAGATFQEEALRMLELGCVEAVNLDGGGSTAMLALYPGNDDVNTINKPSGGSLRNCGNYILLVSEGKATGNLNALHLYPYSPVLLAGAKQQFTAKATDTNYYPVSVPGSLEYAGDALGSVDEKGIYTAGTQAGKSTVTVGAGGAHGSTDVTIVTNPATIAITSAATGQPVGKAISVPAGSPFSFSGTATYNGMPLVAQAQCFQWSVSGEIGTIDSSGVFTPSGSKTGAGTITASVGGKTASVAVNVVSEGEQIENFETAAPKLSLGDLTGVTSSIETDLAYVHNGKQSMKLAYQTQGAENLSIPANISFSKNPSMLTCWVYADKSGNSLTWNVNTQNGTVQTEPVLLNFEGWQQIITTLPSGTTGISGLNINTQAAAKGTVYVDQIMAGYGYYVDNQGPTVTATVTNQVLSAVVSDAVDTKLTKNNIAVTYDGKPQAFTYDGATKKVSATLPAGDGKSHRVSVKAVDASGNVQRASVSIAATVAVEPFADMGGQWAAPYTAYLYNQNIISGRILENGNRCYFPELNMTRAEFSSVMVQWLGIDTAAYSGTVLPFADTAAIPDWALPAVKAIYGSGLMSGRSAEGKVYFTPNGSITRQEVMTVIGHTQERGYGEANLAAQFGDSASVADWAAPYVKTLVAQGVISGYDGKIWPTLYVTRAQVASIIFNLN